MSHGVEKWLSKQNQYLCTIRLAGLQSAHTHTQTDIHSQFRRGNQQGIEWFQHANIFEAFKVLIRFQDFISLHCSFILNFVSPFIVSWFRCITVSIGCKNKTPKHSAKKTFPNFIRCKITEHSFHRLEFYLKDSWMCASRTYRIQCDKYPWNMVPHWIQKQNRCIALSPAKRSHSKLQSSVSFFFAS